jgi:glycosyltransferase involved in cell wall biosynthesis
MLKKILIIGPEPSKSDPLITGGVTVLYANLVEWLKRQHIHYMCIDSNKSNYTNLIFACLLIIKNAMWNIPQYEIVMLNGTANDYIFIVPIIVLWSKFFLKKIVLRKFAGNFDDVYLQKSWIIQRIIFYSLHNAALLLWETKHLVEFGKQFNNNNIWLPNIRFSQNIKTEAKVLEYRKRFCFISHVSEEKGVLDIYEIAKLLSGEYVLDIYGPIIKGFNLPASSSLVVTYKGTLDNTQVVTILQQYDCLLLPTHWQAEGYPGIIIEAFSVGIPVIASRIGGIPEIVENGIEGLLCEPGNIAELYAAITSINNDNLLLMKTAALKKFDQFDADKVYHHIFKAIETL